MCGNIVIVVQERLKRDHNGVSEISEVGFILHFLCENIDWIDNARNVFNIHIFGLMPFSKHIFSWRFRYLIPFEVTVAAH